jgi:SSS family solute:Na+ symporter
MSTNILFGFFFVVFAILLLWIGWFTRKWITDSSDYILAGREVSLLVNIAGVGAIGFAGTSIALGTGVQILYGFWAVFIAFAVIYSFLGLGLYGIIFSSYIRRCGAHTLPEWLEMRFSSRTRTVVTIATVIALIGIVANNIVSMALVIVGYTGYPPVYVMSALFFLFLAFTYLGGLWAVTLTDFLQFVIGLVVIPAIIFTLISNFGFIDYINSQFPYEGNVWNAGLNGSLSLFSLRYPSVLSVFFLFGIFLVWGNNYYWLRIASVRSERAARWSYVLAGIILLVIFYPILALLGAYSTSISPEFAERVKEAVGLARFFEATKAYGVIMKSLPVWIASLGLIAALAASISTSTTAHMGATATAVRDIYHKKIRPNASAQKLVLPSRLIMLLIGILAWVLCFHPGGPIILFAFALAWLGPPSILVLLGAFWRRTTAAGAFWGGLVAIITLTLLKGLSIAKVWDVEQYAHLGIVGVSVTTLLVVVISLVTKPEYYGRKGWTADGISDEELELFDHDKKVLSFIRDGYNTMAEVTDLLSVDSSVSNDIIEKLDRARYIQRMKLAGSNFYTFRLTEKGRQAVPVEDDVKKLAGDGLNMTKLRVLNEIVMNPEAVLKVPEKLGMGALEFSTVIASLVRGGYCKESGLWRRMLSVTEKGGSMVGNYASLLDR